MSGLGSRSTRLPLAHTTPPPGPPPPCGDANVLWRFRWTISNPMSPGLAIPSIAFMFAPS